MLAVAIGHEPGPSSEFELTSTDGSTLGHATNASDNVKLCTHSAARKPLTCGNTGPEVGLEPHSQPMGTLGSPENISKPAQSGRYTTRSEAKSVRVVHMHFLTDFEAPSECRLPDQRAPRPGSAAVECSAPMAISTSRFWIGGSEQASGIEILHRGSSFFQRFHVYKRGSRMTLGHCDDCTKGQAARPSASSGGWRAQRLSPDLPWQLSNSEFVELG